MDDARVIAHEVIMDVGDSKPPRRWPQADRASLGS
jgi:hypothetical protein